MRVSRTGLLALTLAAAVVAPRAQTIAITGGTVVPVSGPTIRGGTVLIQNGKITAVGKHVAVPADARKIDARGKWVTPGLINAGTDIGLLDVGFSGGSNETSADGKDQVSASFQPWLAYNPANVLIPAGREFGITTVAIWPSGNLLAGQGAMLDLGSGTLSDVLLKAPIGMAGQFEADRDAGVGARGELMGKMRELIEDTRSFMANRLAYNAARMRPFAFRRVDMEAMIPVVTGKIPLVLNVDAANDIVAALKLAADYKLKVVIYGGAEAWMVASEIAAAKVPVMTGAMNNIPRSFTSLGARQENAALLRKAGVTVIIVGNAGGGDEDAFNIRNVRFEAGNAVGYGMKWDEALRAITLGPAELFGVADRVGSLRVGLEANIVVWDGDPFEFATRAEHVLVRGVEYTAPSRKDLLTQRYKTLPPDYEKP